MAAGKLVRTGVILYLGIVLVRKSRTKKNESDPITDSLPSDAPAGSAALVHPG